jgi:hypothetical protein
MKTVFSLPKVTTRPSYIHYEIRTDQLLVGYIFCRIPSDTREISELGKLIRDRGSPFFLIQEEGSTPGTLQQIELTPDIISAMIQEQKFHMRKINVRLHNKLAATEIFLYLNEGESYPISGFPRSLLQDCRAQTGMEVTYLVFLDLD